MQEVCYVVEHTKISALLKTLQKSKTHMAIVLDEYGGTLGIVTVEDIIEELVGEIYDEHDEETIGIRDNQDGSFTVNCATEIDEFFEKFNLEVEDEFDANTVGGWVSEYLGELPKVGTAFIYENLNVTVNKTTPKKVVEITVKPTYDELEEEKDN
jgi:CBS domain containing-hemolysin-like protein